MTYPPQDPSSAPAGDPYGQPGPSAQPPAGGYAPGQAGGSPYHTGPIPQVSYTQPQYGQPDPNQAGYSQPDPNQAGYSQPDPNQAGYSQPGQPPGYPPNPYGQYGPPPVMATTKGGGGTAVLIVVVVVLMLVGGVAGYFLLGDRETGTTTAGEESTTGGTEDSPAEEPTEEGQTGDEEEAPVPSGTSLQVASLGSVTPIPGQEWEPYLGPGASAPPTVDTEAYAIHHTEAWISFFGVGLFDAVTASYDPADLQASAQSAMESWTSGAFGSTTGYTAGEIAFSETEVDGRPAVLAEMRNSWESTPSTTDLYEDTAIVVVDVDGVNGFIGIASITESGAATYDPAVDALLATVFDAESA